MYKRTGNWLFRSGWLGRGWQFNIILDKQFSLNGSTKIYFSFSVWRWYLEVEYYTPKEKNEDRKITKEKTGLSRFAPRKV